ncbi:MAG: hypothetical protein COU07_00080 [Candidatus Harrisonbacteria bacterium CG10_big_fil_rev_8_21_14_0_10_40_38]|uniref:DUF5667 domain-containing protein n=1 Tax=Candidatus Harrisonbacteria bacterium CG10_big_fil_rev_8_21_14_0_10_40_38 TaxID=1974583 RepID=A0A2H0UUG9_9BACT|nr:MAG: hypothetical protein COU07_00080 [Candidatus Harrisonbacteria bacterium CG10_big_fil_rev_8_21_14_0_10_40_38]
MDRDIKKALKSFSKISFPEKEKNFVLKNLERYADEIDSASGTAYYKTIFSLFLRQHTAVSLAVFIFIFSMAGMIPVSFAMNSLPGEIFYPIKLSVSEQVLGFFASISSDSYESWDFAVIDRRINEGQLLTENPKKYLTDNRIDSLHSGFASAIISAESNFDKKYADKLNEADYYYSVLEQKINRYENVISKINESDNELGSTESLKKISQDTQNIKNRVVAERARIQSMISNGNKEPDLNDDIADKGKTENQNNQPNDNNVKNQINGGGVEVKKGDRVPEDVFVSEDEKIENNSEPGDKQNLAPHGNKPTNN